MSTGLDQALINLRPGAEFHLKGSKITWVDSKQTEPSRAEIDAELKRLQAEYDAKQYQRDRNYPNIGEQLDMLWHAIDNGEILGDKSCNFFKTLKKVKDDNPKPE